MPRRLMVIAPHSDDAEIGCGGYIAKFVERGGEVMSVVATVGDVHFMHLDRVVTAAEREAEFEEACKVLGVQHHQVLVPGYESKLNMYPSGEVVGMLDDLMETFCPDEVLLPLPSSHQDHVYVYQVAVAACRPTPKKNHLQLIAAYEYPSSGWGAGAGENPSRGGMYVDITAQMSKKKAALDCYKTQMRGEDALISVWGCESLAKLRGIESGFQCAELFHVMRLRVNGSTPYL